VSECVPEEAEAVAAEDCSMTGSSMADPELREL